MTKKQLRIIISSIVVSLIIVGGALLIKNTRSTQSNPAKPVRQHNVSKAELAAANGKNGKDCFVAIDGRVYKIEGFSLWQNGQHVTSNGQAYCGADLSKVIDKSPHGRSVLRLLIDVGPLTN